MLFSRLRLEEEAHCNCMSNAEEDTTRTFIRRTSEATPLKERHLRASVEKAEKDLSANDCTDFCALRELSIDNVDDFPEADVVASYIPEIQKVKIFSPKKEFYYCKFRFKENAGKVKPTPHHGYLSHYDFYKSDDFTIDLIEPVSGPHHIPCPPPAPIPTS